MVESAYEKAGVNITAGEELVADLKQKLGALDPHVLGGLGSFAGCYQLSKDQLDQPVLVAGSDGVGTKVLLAAQSGQVETIGQDLVAMCVNDLLAQGALPLFFLDYLALSHLEKNQVQKILNGILKACQAQSITLLGGETAEMPGIYQKHHFDLAGFAVGLTAKRNLLQAKNVHNGDYLIGLPSSGLHSNGYSLVRKILFEDHDFQFDDQLAGLNGSLIEELMQPTRLYVNVIRPLLKQKLVSGIAHITGGGLLDNVPRMLQDQQQAEFKLDSWEKPTIFKILAELGKLSQTDCYETFNMGIGMVLAVSPDNYARVVAELEQQKETFFKIGKVKKREKDAPVVYLSGGSR
ncbi:phosphoribosylformylglycinamidine cyclo-ligase [Pediococcus pentosaceus]|uniref:phosphoribosylformylglycinamidine cyclo-ligase n=1 Tax=Pediococcus pentosaceus TaxID=1255 RepID=UPI0021E76AD4|nr:phosphoribosylformylglycinamidine cyclo-ligase [Pediococcus pentosaceus]MCV3329716.1 phosphoribosylformylglycinamidine cyclo-ligase [Pediococcus pentosaceus]